MKLILALSVVLLACASTPSPTRCTAGQVSACPCPGGGAGSQACGPDGVYGVCSCTSVDAGPDVALDVPAQPEVATDARADVGLEDLAEVSVVDVLDVQPAEVGSDTPSAPEASVCPAGFGDCNGNPADGCETNIANPGACGACGRACTPLPHTQVEGCVAGRCVPESCEAGFGDCDGNPANGCELGVQDDSANCGMCGRRCPAPPHALPGCSAGRCGVGRCEAGFGDCDGNPANGCEVSLNADASNCGACGRRCLRCTMGRCS